MDTENYTRGIVAWIRAEVEKLRGKDSRNALMNNYGFDLLEMAEKRLGPVIGRDKEITEVIEILSTSIRNPVLIGEPGVGKTAIVQGLAKRIVSGDVPSNIANVRIIALDIASLLAGVNLVGEFEARLKDVLKGVGEGKVVLFIDDFHLVFTQGLMNVGLLLEIILARGQVQCIGATTEEKYRKHVENNAAFQKWFDHVFVAEPSVPDTISILRGIKQKCEKHYGVEIQDRALDIAAQLSDAYIINRRLPDKAIVLLEQACSKVSLQPDCQNVGPDEIVKVVSKWTGLPVTLLREDGGKNLIGLSERLKQRVVGQDHAVEELAEALLKLRLTASFRKPRQPMGSFLLLGPPGVGKTELAKALAEELFGNEDRLVKIDMSDCYREYQYFMARLIGDVSGCPSYSNKAVRRQPCVILIDRVEEGKDPMLTTLLRLLDEGRLTDSQGRTVDFRDALVVLTSSIGAHHVLSGKGSIEAAREKVISEVRTSIKPGLQKRLDKTVVFDPLSREQLRRVARLQFNHVAKRLAERGLVLGVTDAALDFVVESCDAVDGARNIERWLETEMVTELANMRLRDEIGEKSTVYIDAGIDGLTYQVDKNHGAESTSP